MEVMSGMDCNWIQMQAERGLRDVTRDLSQKRFTNKTIVCTESLTSLRAGFRFPGQSCNGSIAEVGVRRYIFLEFSPNPATVGDWKKSRRIFFPPDCTHSRHDLCCEQRMSSKFKKIVVDADLFDAKNIAPDLRELLFDPGARRIEFVPSPVHSQDRGKALRSIFPLGVSGSDSEYESRRNHISRAVWF